jgi:hypothetical protein
MSRSSLAEADPTPTPPPASREQVSEGRLRDDLIERYAHVRSVDELPPELRDNSIIRAIVTMPPEEEARMLAAMVAHREAAALYGDDAAAELAALEAGVHPLQRPSPSAP